MEKYKDKYWFYIECCYKLIEIIFDRLERAKKLQEQREKEMVEKQKQQEIAAGNFFYYRSVAFFCRKSGKFRKIIGRKSPMRLAYPSVYCKTVTITEM